MINLIKRAIVPPIGRYIINAISSSLKMRIVGYENYQYLKEMGKKCVIVFWHGQQFYPIYHFRNNKIAIMVSLSNDGEIQNKILSSFGYEVVRGSSSRGAVSGLIGLIRKMREGSDVAIALDGPRGPYQTAKEGVNYIAIKEDCFVLPIACAFNSYKQFGAWDKYMLPYPYSSGVMLVGRPIMPNKLNIAAMTHKHLEKLLISMSEDAKKILTGDIKPAAQIRHNSESNPSAVIVPTINETETEIIYGVDENAVNTVTVTDTPDAPELPADLASETFPAEEEPSGGDYEGPQSAETGITETEDHIYSFKPAGDDGADDENNFKDGDNDNDNDNNKGLDKPDEENTFNKNDNDEENIIKLRKKNKPELID